MFQRPYHGSWRTQNAAAIAPTPRNLRLLSREFQEPQSEPFHLLRCTYHIHSMRSGRVATFVSDLSMRILRSHSHRLNTGSTSKLATDERNKIEKNEQIIQAPNTIPNLQYKEDHSVLGYYGPEIAEYRTSGSFFRASNTSARAGTAAPRRSMFGHSNVTRVRFLLKQMICFLI